MLIKKSIKRQLQRSVKIMAHVFKTIAYTSLEDFVYGKALKPVTLNNGMVIGGGVLYPEINFTLPPMLITKETMPDVIRNYKEITKGICERAKSCQFLVSSLKLKHCRQ